MTININKQDTAGAVTEIFRIGAYDYQLYNARVIYALSRRAIDANGNLIAESHNNPYQWPYPGNPSGWVLNRSGDFVYESPGAGWDIPLDLPDGIPSEGWAVLGNTYGGYSPPFEIRQPDERYEITGDWGTIRYTEKKTILIPPSETIPLPPDPYARIFDSITGEPMDDPQFRFSTWVSNPYGQGTFQFIPWHYCVGNECIYRRFGWPNYTLHFCILRTQYSFVLRRVSRTVAALGGGGIVNMFALLASTGMSSDGTGSPPSRRRK